MRNKSHGNADAQRIAAKLRTLQATVSFIGLLGALE
jgi:hypothetical protein